MTSPRLRVAPPIAAFACASALAGCGASLPRPPTGELPKDGTIEVPYPPPPAHVEDIPPIPDGADKSQVWVDGQWDWADEWTWLPGGWTTPPKGLYFTPWSTVRHRDGRLFFIPAAWRDKSGQAVDSGATCPVRGGH